MRLHLIVVDEPLFHPVFVRDMIDSTDIVGISLIPEGFGGTRGLKHTRMLFSLFGLKASCILGYKSISLKLLDRLGIRKSSIASDARSKGIPVTSFDNVNSMSHLNKLRQLNPDVIVSSQGQIFSNELLQIPTYGCINRHSSLLPKYRGLYPIFWAMLNDEKYVGVSVHLMESSVDTGMVLAQSRIQVQDSDTLVSLYKKCFAISSETVIEALAAISGNRSPNHTCRESQFGFPTKEDLRLFKKKHKSII